MQPISPPPDRSTPVLDSNLPPASWTIRTGDYPSEACVQTLFEEFAANTPEATALDSEAGALSYRELNARANRVAHFLRSRGVGPDTPVAICTDRSFAMVIGQLGILKAGGVYVPLDPAYPIDRLAWMVKETGTRVLLVQRHLAAPFASLPVEIVRLDDTTPVFAEFPAENPALITNASNLAYLIYTSGSTGLPKGAPIPHRGICRLVRGQDYAPFGPDGRFLLLASPAFDGIIFELWGALLNGGCCVIFPDRWPDFVRLETVIRQCRVTCAWFTTGLFNQVIDHRPETLATVGHVLVGGEALSAPHIRRAQELLPAVRFVNGYGPTECTTFACAYAIGASDQWQCDSVPIGVPLNNTECHIVDGDFRPVPIGEPGELLLGGPGLARGYFHRPELTAEKFIPHLFSGDPAARLYRTGDRCRWLPNGLIEYLGRNDDQIKLRGFRIELGEVTAALLALPGVRNGAVVVRDLSGGKQLVAFAVAADGAVLSPAALRAQLGAVLPEACVPAFIHLLPQLPLTANGKVDRRQLAALPAPENPAPTPAAAAASSPLEATLLAHWRKVLDQPALGPHDDFFAHGGDSLRAIQLALEIQRGLGRNIPIGSLYLHPTAAACARQLATVGDLNDYTPNGRGNLPTLFYVPGVDGVCKLPDTLVGLIKDTHSYYDRLQYPGLDGRTAPLTKLPGIAAEMIHQIRRVRPTGPYSLCGYSMGGVVAHEIACQLIAAGETVSLVILWDSFPPANIRGRSAFGILLAMARAVLTAPIGDVPRRVAECTDLLAPRLRRLLRIGSRRRSSLQKTPKPDDAPHVVIRAHVEQQVYDAANRAFQDYSPGTHAVPVVLFRCQKPDISVFRHASDYGWRQWVRGPIKVRPVDCKHHDMFMEPFRAQIMTETAAEMRAAATSADQ